MAFANRENWFSLNVGIELVSFTEFLVKSGSVIFSISTIHDFFVVVSVVSNVVVSVVSNVVVNGNVVDVSNVVDKRFI